MTELVQLTKQDGIAIITIDNPPVNALSPGVPEGIADAIAVVEKDDTVVSAVVIGAGRTFVAGADIKEFGKMTSGASPRRCFESLRTTIGIGQGSRRWIQAGFAPDRRLP